MQNINDFFTADSQQSINLINVNYVEFFHYSTFLRIRLWVELQKFSYFLRGRHQNKSENCSFN